MFEQKDLMFETKDQIFWVQTFDVFTQISYVFTEKMAKKIDHFLMVFTSFIYFIYRLVLISKPFIN